MSQDISLKADKRDGTGKAAVAKIRSQGLIPAVIQEHGKESVSLSIKDLDMQKAYESVGRSQALELVVGSKKYLALIKEVNFVNLKPNVEHVVFQALKQDEPVDAEVPVHIEGDIPAEGNRLVVLRTIESLEIRALPKNLPESLVVSADKLVEVGDRVDVRDIDMPSGVELVQILALEDDEDQREEFLGQPIAVVKEPSVVESDEGVELEEGESESDAVESEHGSAGEDSSLADDDGEKATDTNE